MKRIIFVIIIFFFNVISLISKEKKIVEFRKNSITKTETNKISHKKPRIYKVWIWQETGDCLWNIAKKYYGDPFKWKLIYEENRDKIKEPHKIFPKQKLIIPYIIDGKITE